MNYRAIAAQQIGYTALIIGEGPGLPDALDKHVARAVRSPDEAMKRPDMRYDTVYVMDPDSARWPREILELAGRQARARVVVVSPMDAIKAKRLSTTEMYETMRDYGHAGNIAHVGDGWQAFSFEVPYA